MSSISACGRGLLRSWSKLVRKTCQIVEKQFTSFLAMFNLVESKKVDDAGLIDHIERARSL